MGLASNSRPIRDYLFARNVYNPQTIYDLNKNEVTQTLNAFQNAGFDPRSSVALNVLEAAVQNTPLVRIGAERLAIEFARKAVDNLSNKISQSINVGALFDGDPSTKLFRRAKDFTITPTENEGKLNFSNLADKLFGVNDTQNPLDKKGSFYQPGGLAFYVNLGGGQRDALESNMAQNFYSYNFKRQFLNNDGQNTILRFLYSDLFIDRSMNLDDIRTFGYTENDTFSYVRDKNIKVVSTLVSDDPLLNELNDTLNNRDLEKNILLDEGFGITDLGSRSPDDSTYNNIYTEDREFKYGISDVQEYGIQRGLLYYTNQIASVKKELSPDTIQYKINSDGTTLYKGASECRSFTVFRQYGDDQSTLMRYAGNSEPDSVLRDSVFAKIHPVPSDFDEKNRYKDDTHFMFSLENLAYNTSEWNTLPFAQKGSNGGKLMWFPPYGLQISEVTEATWEAERLIGRIEPIHSYAGGQRKAQIKFMLLIDTPPNVNNYEKWDLNKYFSGCDVQESIIQESNPIDNSNEVNKPSDIVSTSPVNPSTTRVTLDGMPVQYYFQNDVDDYQSSYELTSDGKTSGDKSNLYSLNSNYSTSEQKIIDFLKTDNGTDIQIVIEGNASKLAPNDYNIKLSLRRAFNIASRIIVGSNLTFQDFNDFLTSSAYIKSSTKDKGKAFVFNAVGEKKISLTLKGFGEPNGSNESDNDNALRKQVDSEISKKQRFTRLSVSYLPNVANSASSTNIPQNPTDIENKNAVNEQNDNSTSNNLNSKMDQGTKPFLKTIGDAGIGYQNAKGFDKVDYYKPTYHSQTPFNFWERYTFLQQLTRPGSTLDKLNNSNMAVNSIFGKAPSVIMRVGDFWHSRVIIHSIQFEFGEDMTWDLNPEGMGVQPNLCTITMDITILGGMSMKYAVDQIQTAIDQNYLANSTFNPNGNLKKYYDSIKQNRGSAMNSQDTQGILFKNNKNSR